MQGSCVAEATTRRWRFPVVDTAQADMGKRCAVPQAPPCPRSAAAAVSSAVGDLEDTGAVAFLHGAPFRPDMNARQTLSRFDGRKPL